MATSDIQNCWIDVFPERVRPEVYTSEELNEDGFRPLADPLNFITDISKLTASQLYTQSANNQIALQQAQAEYLELEKLVNHIKSKDPTAVASTKNMQELPAYYDFEERKESVLYGYKYDPNRPLAPYGRWHDASETERRDLRSYQDPFAQGGFVPNDRQFKGLMNRAKDKRNPDSWKPIERKGKRLIPRMAPRVNEKEEYWQLSGLLTLTKGTNSKPVTRSGTPDIEHLDGRNTPVNKRLRNTRFNGAKVPLTRDVSEAPSLPVSRASTPKRKRGDTPVRYIDQDGSPAKKTKLVVKDTELAPRRKHHNQYTKAKEKAAREAVTTNKVHVNEDIKMIDASGLVHGSSVFKEQLPKRPWSGLSPEEMRAYHWNNETLKLAVADDFTWLTDEISVSTEWRDKILASTYPVRTHSMFKKWREWRENGEDKRPRNRNKLNVSTDSNNLDTGSEIATATPSPLSRGFQVADVPEDDESYRGTPVRVLGPSRLARSQNSSQTTNNETDDEVQSGFRSNQTSGSGTPSQTISVSQDPPSTNGNRRTTRAGRKTSG